MMNLWRKLNKGCLLLFAIPFLVLIGLLLFVQLVWGGSIKPSLDAQYIPTAEYLLEHPQPTPSLISVHPEPSTLLTSSDTVTVTALFNEEIDDIGQWSQFFINHQKISRDDIDVALISGIPSKKGIYVGYFNFYLNNRLAPGLHLFRIQVGSSFNDFLNPDPKLSYEWAYRVE